MHPVEELPKVPLSRFRREMNSIFRRKKPVLITVKGEELAVCCPNGSEEAEAFNQFSKELGV